ncbi:MAG: galactokinase family protein [Eubacteriales bacterium]|nr:galactokinase family protein [Eubacteriales bacterium]
MAKKIEILKKELLDGVYRERLLDLYGDEAVIERQTMRYVKALEEFEALYDCEEVEIYSAPGRSEVGGNHTDHQHGKVIAASVDLDIIAVVAPTEGTLVKIKSEGYRPFEVDINDLEKGEAEESMSRALVKGIAYRLKELGYAIGGFCAYMTSDVFNGAGVSSSAAFEILLGSIFSGLYNNAEIDAVTLAQVGQFAENVYGGKPCGLLDQMACSVGGMVYVDFKDPAAPEVEPVHADFSAFGHRLCLINTGGSHANLTDEYAAIPAEIKAVAGAFGKEVLREVDQEEFFAKIPELREAYGDRAVLRAIHVFEENKRVELEKKALEDGDFEAFKVSVKESGRSSFSYLQNVYTNKNVQEQAVSVGLAVSDMILGKDGVSRVHGGGFAGTIQAFVPKHRITDYKESMEKVFGKDSCCVMQVRKYGGIKVM